MDCKSTTTKQKSGRIAWLLWSCRRTRCWHDTCQWFIFFKHSSIKWWRCPFCISLSNMAPGFAVNSPKIPGKDPWMHDLSCHEPLGTWINHKKAPVCATTKICVTRRGPWCIFRVFLMRIARCFWASVCGCLQRPYAGMQLSFLNSGWKPYGVCFLGWHRHGVST